MTRQSSLELAVDAKAELGEGPVWYEKEQRLYWVDILKKQLHWHEPENGTNGSVTLDQYVGAAAVRESGGFVLAMTNGFYTLAADMKTLTSIADPETEKPENRFNDGKCDPAGRFWAGTMSLTDAANEGALYCLDTDLSVTSKRSPVSTSNGLTWSPDETTMYYIDSPTRKIIALDYDVNNGEIRNPRTVVEIERGGATPDGMTIDCEGMLWIAEWDGGRVGRWNPENGELLSVVEVPAARATSCMFGGPDLHDLYITTARTGLSEKQLESTPQAGGLFRFRTNVQGIPAYTFKG